jgi:hypothetical protein
LLLVGRWLVVELLCQAVPAAALVVAVDPGKVRNRVWLTSGERGLIGEPASLPVLREGVEALSKLIEASGVAGPPLIGVEATGGLHRAWVAELERHRLEPSLDLVPVHPRLGGGEARWTMFPLDSTELLGITVVGVKVLGVKNCLS